MAKSKKWPKLIKNHQKWVKVTKNEWSNFTLRNDPPQVLAMGVDVGAKNRSKEGLIFKIPYAKLKNVKKQLKIMFCSKSSKSEKVTKTGKRKKWENQKSEKIKIIKNQQNAKPENVTKKVSKIDPPSKRPKCHLNGQNRHFVNSEPPGPAFFEFQGVPRDPVLRPKSTPLFLMAKNDHVLCIFMIYSFCILSFLINFDISHFDHFDVCDQRSA